ncbi:dual-action HEIGH metallo-peptidase [Chitinophaga skermanii]|uniref:Dual-action HEIGH metallo-peptidase n=1 Tax=Chitinophaga skermanii TaxID=331697 RepID=A0A327QCS6_9BACT|nr:M57 family metalloprotease [Chitinophaga skermanii]RAJ02290.1 dual-action HEIGH metallo-peptidase [Chitinophaga skermanii]
MKKQITLALSFVALLAAVLVVSCQKDAHVEPAQSSDVPAEVLAKIKAKGFSTEGARIVKGGYLVENDIILDDNTLNTESTSPNLRIAEVEQYRTSNLVTGLPRVITVKVTGLGTAFVQGTDLAISRYNALGLLITFQRITSGTANINIVGFYQAPSGGFITLGSAGFPSGGNPYNQISMNTHPNAYGTNPNVNYVGSVIQHEIGHCIGFRHTDYMNRAYSCGSGGNEGTAGVGAVLIPGTPSGPDANSWMLACSNGGNRTFNANDIVALNYLY